MPEQTVRSPGAARSGMPFHSDAPPRRMDASFEPIRSGVSERAERLLRITGAIARAVTPAEVYSALVHDVSAAVGASSGGLWLLDEELCCARLVQSFGYPESARERWSCVPLASGPIIPALEAFRSALPLWIPSQRVLLERYPLLCSSVDPTRSYRVSCLPLLAEGRTVGVLGLTIEEERQSSEEERSFLLLVAAYASQAIRRLRILEAERQSRARLEETVRYNELFAGVLAHDLRNPLSAIMTAAQLLLLRADESSERVSRPATHILVSGQRMMRMVEQLLDFTRARAGGGIEVRRREANLAELCSEAVEELALAHPEWQMRSQCTGNPRGVWDPDRLLQVISNLVANAGQHGKVGQAIELTLDGSRAELVTLVVHNQGAVPPSLMGDLFNPFRGTRHRRDHSRGLGLGLFIVREIVRAHGGRVDVCSDAAAGTRFVVQLPRTADLTLG